VSGKEFAKQCREKNHSNRNDDLPHLILTREKTKFSNMVHIQCALRAFANLLQDTDRSNFGSEYSHQ
jgi:hypothetical protein